MNTTTSTTVEPDSFDYTTEISLLAPVGEGIARFMDDNPDWDLDRLVNGAIALFLLQKAASSAAQVPAAIRKVYLGSVLPTENLGGEA